MKSDEVKVCPTCEMKDTDALFAESHPNGECLDGLFFMEDDAHDLLEEDEIHLKNR